MTRRQRLIEIMKFCLAGGVGVGLYYSLLYTLTELAGLWYLFSVAIAAIVNLVADFLLQKFWTFRNADKHQLPAQAVWYTLLHTGLYLANLGLMYTLVTIIGIWYIEAQIPVTIILSAISYLISRKIFKVTMPIQGILLTKQQKFDTIPH